MCIIILGRTESNSRRTQDLRPPQGRNHARRSALFCCSPSWCLQASFNLKFISPDSNQQLLFFAGLSGLIFFAFVALTVVLGRNLLKLYAERRQGVAGSKFRTRLVVVSLLLSFLPVIAMFWFSYGLMNRSIDKWFSQPVEEVRADTAAMSALLYDYAGQNAASEAQSIAQSDEFQRSLCRQRFFRRQRRTSGAHPDPAGRICPRHDERHRGSQSEYSSALVRHARQLFPYKPAMRGEHPHFQWGQTDYILAAAPLHEGERGRRHASAAKIRPNRQADSGKPDSATSNWRQKESSFGGPI